MVEFLSSGIRELLYRINLNGYVMGRKEADEWLTRAKGWLSLAKYGRTIESGVLQDQVYYLCQQARECAFKAVCESHGIAYDKGKDGHNLEKLIQIIEKNGITIPDEVKM
jgi:HEPN domain-containing protein